MNFIDLFIGTLLIGVFVVWVLWAYLMIKYNKGGRK